MIEVSNLITTTLTSPECAVLHSELYANNFTEHHAEEQEHVFKSILYREAEDVRDYNRYDVIATEYLKLDIFNTFHISLKEYLDTTPEEKDHLNMLALARINELEQQRVAIEKENKGLLGDMDEYKQFNG